jgi:hypothetical protein
MIDSTTNFDCGTAASKRLLREQIDAGCNAVR